MFGSVAQLVEQAAVNRLVVGSSPSVSVECPYSIKAVRFLGKEETSDRYRVWAVDKRNKIRLYGLMVKVTDCRSVDSGSIPDRVVTNSIRIQAHTDAERRNDDETKT